MSNYVSAVLTADSATKAIAALDLFKTFFPFGLHLDPSVRKTMPKMDDGRKPFVEKALQYAKSEPRIVPPYTDLAELAKDLTLYNALSELERKLIGLTEMISDTRTAAGSDAYVAALSIYNSAKAAAKAGVPGTNSIVDELSKLFIFQGKTKVVTEAKN